MGYPARAVTNESGKRITAIDGEVSSSSFGGTFKALSKPKSTLTQEKEKTKLGKLTGISSDVGFLAKHVFDEGRGLHEDCCLIRYYDPMKSGIKPEFIAIAFQSKHYRFKNNQFFEVEFKGGKNVL